MVSHAVRKETAERTHHLRQDDGPETGQMLVIDAAEEDSKAEVDLRKAPINTCAETETGQAHLGVHDLANTRPQQVDQLLLDHRQLRQETVLLRRQEGVGEAAKTEGARERLEFAIGEDVGRRRRRDFCCG